VSDELDVESRKITLDDLFHLSYFTNRQVVVEVVGGRETRERIHHDGWVYALPEDEDELLVIIDKARRGERAE